MMRIRKMEVEWAENDSLKITVKGTMLKRVIEYKYVGSIFNVQRRKRRGN
jgi:hypothetical protein